MSTTTLKVFKGEAQENITILNKDVLGQDVDLSWATSGDSTIEIKDKPSGTVKATLTGADILSLGTATTIIDGAKLYGLAGGEYFVKFSAKDAGGRTKILTFHLLVKDV